MSKDSYRQEIYTHYLGENVDSQAFVQSLNRDQIYRQFQGWWGDKLPKNKHLPILDIGCGYGGFLAFLQSQGYTDLSGVDSSPQQVEIAQLLGLKNVIVGDVFEALHRHQNYYTCISAFNVLEHLDKEMILPFLRAAKSALRDDGCLLLELPNSNSLFGARTRYWDFTHELSFTPTSLLQILHVVGFTNIQLRERSPVVHGVKSYVRFVLWQLIRQGLSFYLMVEQGSAGYKIFSQDMHAIVYK
jgi:2-polyprenyl-3-methyl-5-hydroxy-6-metoxy-1,4-benzoquinol methylase